MMRTSVLPLGACGGYSVAASGWKRTSTYGYWGSKWGGGGGGGRRGGQLQTLRWGQQFGQWTGKIEGDIKVVWATLLKRKNIFIIVLLLLLLLLLLFREGGSREVDWYVW